MHLVDDRIFHWPAQRSIAFPIIIAGVDNDGAHGRREIVLWTAGVRAFPQRVGVASRIWIDQNLVLIEAKPCARVGGAVQAEGIERARPQATNIDMPKWNVLLTNGSNRMTWKGSTSSDL